MTTLVIARHGNTFGPDDVPTRVGARTDLPLVESGRAQAARLGDYLAEQALVPDRVFTSTLQRTREMARIALERCGVDREPEALNCFDEIDYGPDENQPESDVVARVGQAAIDAWNQRAEVPPGWRVDPDDIVVEWRRFADGLIEGGVAVALVVTSNGVARFAPHVTDDFEGFLGRHHPKLSTGAVGIFRHGPRDDSWVVDGWNIRP